MTEPVIRIEQLVKTYGSQRVLQYDSLSIPAGQTLALLGSSRRLIRQPAPDDRVLVSRPISRRYFCAPAHGGSSGVGRRSPRLCCERWSDVKGEMPPRFPTTAQFARENMRSMGPTKGRTSRL